MARDIVDADRLSNEKAEQERLAHKRWNKHAANTMRAREDFLRQLKRSSVRTRNRQETRVHQDIIRT